MLAPSIHQARKPKFCSHCGEKVTANELFGRDDRWLHRPCAHLGPIALDKQAQQVTRRQYRELVHKSVKAKELGQIEGYTVYRVDGEWVRDHVDVNFRGSANCATEKSFVPEGEVWIEADLSDKDAGSRIVREIVECDALLDGQDASKVAAEVERAFRDSYDGGNAFRAAEQFLAQAAEPDEQEPEHEGDEGDFVTEDQLADAAEQHGAFEVTAAEVGGLQLRRKGYQRYVAEHVDEEGESHKVWIGGEHQVQKGSYDGNKRQRRKMHWVVKVDGKEIGEETSLKAARQLAEAHLGIVAAPVGGQVEVGEHDLQPPGLQPPMDLAQALAPPAGAPDPLAALRLATIEVRADELTQDLTQPDPVFDPNTPWHVRQRPDGSWYDEWSGKPLTPEEAAHAQPPAVDTQGEEARNVLKERLQPLLSPSQKETVEKTKKTQYQRPEGAFQPSRKTPPKSAIALEQLGVTPNGGLANIIAVLKHARGDEVAHWKDWYSHAKEDAGALAARWKSTLPYVNEDLAAAVVAIMSPNTKWEENVFAADQMFRGVGKQVIDYRKTLDEEALENWAANIYPELYTEKKTLGGRVYLINITKAQRLIDAAAASGKKNFPIDVDQPMKLSWNKADAADTARAEKVYNEKTARGWTPRLTKVVLDDKPKKTKDKATGQTREVIKMVTDPATGRQAPAPPRYKRTWQQSDTLPLGAPFPWQEGRLVLTPPFKAAETPKTGPNKGKTKSPPKITAFYETIKAPNKNAETVVLDGHAINIWRGVPEPLDRLKKNQPNDSTREQMIADYKQAALMSQQTLASVGIKVPKNLSPQQVQAVTWTVWRDAVRNSGGDADDVEDEGGDEESGGEEGGGVTASLIVGERWDDEVTAVMLGEYQGVDQRGELLGRRAELGGGLAGVIKEDTYHAVFEGLGLGRVHTQSMGETAGLNQARDMSRELFEVTARDLDYVPDERAQRVVDRVVQGPSKSYVRDPAMGADLARQMFDPKDNVDDRVIPEIEFAPDYERDPEMDNFFSGEGAWPDRPTFDSDFGLTPQDPKRPDSNTGRANIERVLSQATPEEVDLYKDWYLVAHNQAKMIAAESGHSLEVIAAVIAALSPGSQWEANLRAARRLALGQSVKGTGGVYPVNVYKAMRALKSGDPKEALTGDLRKVMPFYETLVNPKESAKKAVVDRHMFGIWYGDPKMGEASPPDTVYRQIQGDVLAVAEAHGLSVQAVQAVTWVLWRNRAGTSREEAHEAPSEDEWKKWKAPQMRQEEFASKEAGAHVYDGGYVGFDGVWYPYVEPGAYIEVTASDFSAPVVNLEDIYDLPGDTIVQPVGLGMSPMRLDQLVIRRPRAALQGSLEEAAEMQAAGFSDIAVVHGSPTYLRPGQAAKMKAAYGDEVQVMPLEQYLHMVSEPDVEELRVAYLREDKEPGDSAGVFIRIPDEIAASWSKEGRAGEDSSPPHFTLLYLGPTPPEKKDELVDIVTRVAAEHGPLSLELAEGVDWFENHKGQSIAHKSLEPESLSDLAVLHQAMKEAVSAAGFEVKHKEPFIAHATLAYCPERSYSGPVPEGSFLADTVEVWGWPDDVVVDLASLARAARRRGSAWKVPVELTGPMLVTAAQVEAARKRRRKEKRKRFSGETYWMQKDSQFARTTSAAAGDDAVEIRLDPGARVLREGERDFIDLGHDPSIEEVMKAAFDKGYDAVRVKDRLAVLNQDAVVERTSARPGWMRA